jgi:hypothetical protein
MGEPCQAVWAGTDSAAMTSEPAPAGLRDAGALDPVLDQLAPWNNEQHPRWSAGVSGWWVVWDSNPQPTD